MAIGYALCMCARHVDSTNPGRSNFVFRSKPIAEAEMSNRLIIIHQLSQLNLGVDPNKSTCVDLRTSSRVGSVVPGAVDSKSNLELKSDFTARRLEIDLN